MKRSWIGRATLVAALAVAGCSANSAADVGSEPDPPEVVAQDAIDALSITPDQQDQLMALMGKFAIVLSKSGKARRAFTKGILEAIKAGGVDRKAIDPLRDDFAKEIRDATPEVQALLNELHGILDAKQRTQLVDGLAERAEASEAKRKARNKEMIKSLDMGLLQKIAIGSAIKDKMEPLKPALDKMRSDGKAATEAFKADDFDAKKLELFKTDLGKLYLSTVIVLVEGLAPELEPEQRTKLAGKIKHRLGGGGRRKRGR